MAEVVTISIPLEAIELRSDYSGFRTLAELNAKLIRFQNEAIQIDCSTLSWVDAHLAAPLMTVVNHSKAKGNTHQLTHLPEKIRLILMKNQLLKARAVDSNHTTMPVTHFRLDEEVEFANYTRQHMNRREMPRMSAALQGKFYEGIDELFANSALHSKSPIAVTVAGQFFPRTEKLAFVISDGGRGVDGSLRAAGYNFSTPDEAIDWAMQPNNTSRQGYIPGGLGLRLLRDFVEANHGKLTVASTKGIWIQSGREVVKRSMRRDFPGTAVVLEINTSDKKRYDLKKATDPRNIW